MSSETIKKMNPLAVYHMSGDAAGAARRRGATGVVRMETEWSRRAFRLEKEPYRTECKREWFTAYAKAFKENAEAGA